MGNTFFFGWEIDFINWLQSFESPITSAIAKFFTMCGEEYALILILGFIYWCIDKKLGRRISLALTGGAIFGTLVKGAFLRRRPYLDNQSVKCIRAAYPDKDILNPVEQGFSMPILHATMSAAVYGTLAHDLKKKFFLIIGLVMPFLIGLSRPFLGVHYPTDVLAGWALGAASLFILGYVERKFGYKTGFISILVIGCAGFFYCRDIEFFSSYGVTLGTFLSLSFEERFVSFEMPEHKLSYVIRPILGVAVFIVISALFKLPIKNSSMSEVSAAMLIYRVFRYTVSTFVTIGIYPFVFKKIK